MIILVWSEEQIKKVIEITGLPTEIKVSEILKKNKWSISHQFPYLDSDKNIIRTLDLKANRLFKKSNDLKNDTSDNYFNCLLFIECKKSINRSWVFATEKIPDNYMDYRIKRLSHDLVYDTYNLTIKSLTKSEEHTIPINIFNKIPVIYQNIDYNIGLSHEIAFIDIKKQKREVERARRNFYVAQMQILKAIAHQEHIIMMEDYKKMQKIDMIIPLIVFNGNMFECYYEKDDLIYKKIDFLRYLTHGLPKQEIPIIIDVTTLNFFPEYLNLLEGEIRYIINKRFK